MNDQARQSATRDRTRCWARMEKLLEDALIKVSAVASKLTTLSVQDMIRAMIAGQRDPQLLAGLARSRMKAKHDALAEALADLFTDHHAELAQLLLDQIAFLDTQIARLTMLIGEQLASIRAAWGIDADGATGPATGCTGLLLLLDRSTFWGFTGIALHGRGDVAFCGWVSNRPTRWVRNWTFRVTHPNLMVGRVTESRFQGGTRREHERTTRSAPARSAR
jgi:hypothetical protein